MVWKLRDDGGWGTYLKGAIKDQPAFVSQGQQDDSKIPDNWNLIKQLFWRIFENLVVKPESVEELPPLLPSLSVIKEIYQNIVFEVLDFEILKFEIYQANAFWSCAWKWRLAMKKGKFLTCLRNPTSPQRSLMLRSAPCEN